MKGKSLKICCQRNREAGAAYSKECLFKSNPGETLNAELDKDRRERNGNPEENNDG